MQYTFYIYNLILLYIKYFLKKEEENSYTEWNI